MADVTIAPVREKQPLKRRFGRPLVLVSLALLAIVAGMAVRALMVSVPVERAPGVALADVPQGVTLHHVNGEDVWIDRAGDQLTAFLDDAHHLGHGVVYCAGRGVFMSPAHGELFARNGVALDGPATRGLDRLPVEVEAAGGATRVVIDTSSVSAGPPKVAPEDRHLYVGQDLLDEYDAGPDAGFCS
jgi:nitrite reductase/ring-hydroxylating ferredoxin subunit